MIIRVFTYRQKDPRQLKKKCKTQFVVLCVQVVASYNDQITCLMFLTHKTCVYMSFSCDLPLLDLDFYFLNFHILFSHGVSKVFIVFLYDPVQRQAFMSLDLVAETRMLTIECFWMWSIFKKTLGIKQAAIQNLVFRIFNRSLDDFVGDLNVYKIIQYIKYI